MYRHSVIRRLRITALTTLALILASHLAIAADGVVSSKVDLSVWGCVKFDASYDTGNLRDFTDFATYLTTENDAELNFNPRDTRFGFAASSSEGDWSYLAVVEVDFYGDNADNNLPPPCAWVTRNSRVRTASRCAPVRTGSPLPSRIPAPSISAFWPGVATSGGVCPNSRYVSAP